MNLRRRFAGQAVSLALPLVWAGAAMAADRPHLLWLTVETMSPNLGCYGNAFADTPVLREFAARSRAMLGPLALFLQFSSDAALAALPGGADGFER